MASDDNDNEKGQDTEHEETVDDTKAKDREDVPEGGVASVAAGVRK